MYSAIVFDVNETLLDLSALDPAFDNHFGPGDFRREWFNEVLKLAFVTTIVGRYSDYGVIGKAALEVLEKRHGKLSPEGQREDLLSNMRKLPAHADVSEGLETLRKEGLSLVALTNSTESSAEVQLISAGIRNYFQFVFSADSVKRLKLATEPYHMAGGQGTRSCAELSANGGGPLLGHRRGHPRRLDRRLRRPSRSDSGLSYSEARFCRTNPGRTRTEDR